MDEKSLAELALEADPSLRDFFLGRLASLLIRQLAAVDPAEGRALSQAVFSTFLDCVTLGLTDQANAVLEYVHDAMYLGDDLAA